ncbi:preprotein translocase subunit Sec61beta [Candidatus Pacearchaeota archaeon]|nr:preprotein translocase subunit Sec61beta [Candidatus Pacearchaeota archaeon]
MADNIISTPSGFGGLMRYNEEYPSKFKLSPIAVVSLIIAVILFVIALNIFFPVSAG